MSGREPALGTAVLIRGKFVGIDLATNSARVETPAGVISAPWANVIDGTTTVEAPDAESKWREHRDANVSRGLSINGISRRDFMAGYAAANH